MGVERRAVSTDASPCFATSVRVLRKYYLGYVEYDHKRNQTLSGAGSVGKSRFCHLLRYMIAEATLMDALKPKPEPAPAGTRDGSSGGVGSGEGGVRFAETTTAIPEVPLPPALPSMPVIPVLIHVGALARILRLRNQRGGDKGHEHIDLRGGLFLRSLNPKLHDTVYHFYHLSTFFHQRNCKTYTFDRAISDE